MSDGGGSRHPARAGGHAKSRGARGCSPHLTGSLVSSVCTFQSDTFLTSILSMTGGVVTRIKETLCTRWLAPCCTPAPGNHLIIVRLEGGQQRRGKGGRGGGTRGTAAERLDWAMEEARCGGGSGTGSGRWGKDCYAVQVTCHSKAKE